MSSPPDGAARDSQPASPAPEPKVAARVPPPPQVGPPPMLGNADRTVVTRRPRPTHGPSEPHELMPTLRMPPVEARALRRQVNASLGESTAPAVAPAPADAPELADVAVHTDVAELAEAPVHVEAPVRADADAIEAPRVETGEIDVAPEAHAVASDERREQALTVRVAAIPVEPMKRPSPRGALPAHPRARRPPLPLPDVLRQGPKAPPTTRDEPPRSTATVPEPMPVIDTASLVLEVAESLIVVTPEATAQAAAASPAVDADDDARPITEAATTPSAPAAAEPELDFVVAAGMRVREPKAPVTATVTPARRPWRAAAVIAAGVIVIAAVRWMTPDAAPVAAADAPPPRDQQQWQAGAEPGAAVAERAPLAERAPAPSEPAPAVSPLPPPPTEATPPPAEPAPELAAAAVVAEPEPEPAAPPSEASATATKPAAAAERKPAAKKQKRSAAPAKVATPPPPQPAVAKPAAPPDAAALLREAEQAYASGRHAAALKAAQRSAALRSDAKATRLIVLAACKLGREDLARQSFSRLPLSMRKAVKATCKDAGVRVGL